jgi:hypothetical protein
MTDEHASALKRLDEKVDRLTEAITQLVRVEERQISQAERIANLEKRAVAAEANWQATDRKLDSWINRGIGVWGLVVAIWTIYLAMRP